MCNVDSRQAASERWPSLVRVTAVVVLAGLALVGCGAQQQAAPPEEQQPQQSAATPTVEWVADGAITEGEYAGDQDLGPYHLYWRQAGNIIEIGMEADTTGWIAVGIQPGRSMLNADLILGDVTGAGVEVIDAFGTGSTGPHSPDTELGGTYDILSYGGSETGDHTVVEFSRKMDTGDEYDNAILAGEANQVIWAFGTSDDTDMRHGTRGYGDIML